MRIPIKATAGSRITMSFGIDLCDEAKLIEKNTCTPIITSIMPAITVKLIPVIVMYAIIIINAGTNIMCKIAKMSKKYLLFNFSIIHII
jgi:hypothetical protein